MSKEANAMEQTGQKESKPKKQPVHQQDLLAARKGDHEALQRVMKTWEEAGVLDRTLSLFTYSIKGFLRDRYGEDYFIAEAMRRKMEQMQTELLGSNPSPLECLLVERIVLCWEHVGHMEQQYARKQREGISLEKAAFFERSLDRAQKRYLNAIHSLAVVRRLQLPAVQVNIGEKQVNLIQQGIQANIASHENEQVSDNSSNEM